MDTIVCPYCEEHEINIDEQDGARWECRDVLSDSVRVARTTSLPPALSCFFMVRCDGQEEPVYAPAGNPVEVFRSELKKVYGDDDKTRVGTARRAKLDDLREFDMESIWGVPEDQEYLILNNNGTWDVHGSLPAFQVLSKKPTWFRRIFWLNEHWPNDKNLTARGIIATT